MVHRCRTKRVPTWTESTAGAVAAARWRVVVSWGESERYSMADRRATASFPGGTDIRLSYKRRSWAQGSRLARQVKATSGIRAAVLAAKTAASWTGGQTVVGLAHSRSNNYARSAVAVYAA